ncbi:unnamed protein product [Orchesella dallaii]|uniref:Gustatory receptor n=1 Tax=Orchesella dallaii TaxID=48710 RepID=A0ABP1RDF1_9HEXA
MYSIPRAGVRRTLLMLLRPLIHVNFILGTCPFVISSSGEISCPLKYFNIARFLLITSVFFTFACTAVVKLMCSLYTDEEVTPFWNSESKHGFVLAKCVDIACGFYANLIPFVFLCLASIKRNEILRFFDVMADYSKGINGFGDLPHVKKVTNRLYILHGSFGIATSLLLAVRYFTNASYGPAAMVLSFWNGINPIIIIWTTSLFSIYLSFAKTAVMAFIEVACITQATCFCKVIDNLLAYLNEMMSYWNTRFLELPLTGSILHHHPQRNPDPVPITNGGKSRKIQMDFENYLQQIRNYNDEQELSHLGSIDNPKSGKKQRQFLEYSPLRDLTPGQQMVHAIDTFQSVQNMQTAANGLFGFVLALNVGLMIFMCVVLKYMLIWNFGMLKRNAGAGGGVETPSYLGSYNASFPTKNSTMDVAHIVNSPTEWTMFALFDICYFFRLLVLIVSLGNVHCRSLKFNSRLTRAFLQAQKIIDSLDFQGSSNKMFRGRPVLTPSEANMILAFITENSANPMAFSAAGLFVFSRNLILVIMSIIVTYLVFLLQV